LACLADAAAQVAGPALLIVGESMALAQAGFSEAVSEIEVRGRGRGVRS
jgi:hypothetical protein